MVAMKVHLYPTKEEYKKRGGNASSITRVEKSLSDAKAALKYIMEKKMKKALPSALESFMTIFIGWKN